MCEEFAAGKEREWKEWLEWLLREGGFKVEADVWFREGHYLYMITKAETELTYLPLQIGSGSSHMYYCTLYNKIAYT